MSDNTLLRSGEHSNTESSSQLMEETSGKSMSAPSFDLSAGDGFSPVQLKKSTVTSTSAPIQMQTERKKGKGVNDHLKISDQGLQFIIKNEGMVKNTSGSKHVLYDDSEGFATIGYGHLVAKEKVANLSTAEKTKWKDGLTEAEALALLKKDATKYEKALRGNVTTELQQHEFDALISWSFNVGKGWFGAGGHDMATAIKKINSGDMSEVGNSLGMFQNADGKFNQGVLNRRNREINVFNYGYGDKDDPYHNKGDMAAPKGKDKHKEDYWGKHLEKHKDLSKLDKFGSALDKKTSAEIWKESGENIAKVAEVMLPAMSNNPTAVENMITFLGNQSDDLAYALVDPASETALRKINTDLLKKLKSAMNSGWVTVDEYKAVGKLDYIIDGAAEDKATAEKAKGELAEDTKALVEAKKVKNKDTPLEKSVGKEGINQAKDVKLVIARLRNLNIITEKEAQTKDAEVIEQLIRRYQRRVFGKYEDGLISPNGTTANRLLQGVRGVANLSQDKIKSIEDKERSKKQDSLGSASSSDKEVKKLYDSVGGDAVKLGKLMADYLRTNTKMVSAMLDYSGYLNSDNVAFHTVKNVDDRSLKSADKALLQKLYDLMDGGYTDAEDYKMMAKLAEYIAMPEDLSNFDEKELDVKKYWKSQGSTPNCDIYTKKVIDGHKKDNPDLYKNFGDIGSGKTDRKNSFHFAWEEEWEKGTSRTQGKKNANDISTLEKDGDEWEMAVRYITACIEEGVPVMVGVNHTFAYSRASGNGDKSTDHWLTVIGKGSDEQGKYFVYTDPGTSYKTTGTNSAKNRLYQSKDNAHIWRDETKYANSDAGKGSYTMIAVTLYDKHRGQAEFKVGGQSFSRKL